MWPLFQTRPARAGLAALLLLSAACSPKMSYQAMAAQPRYEPYEASNFFRSFLFHSQCSEKRSDSRIVHLAAHHRIHHFVRLIKRQMIPLNYFFQISFHSANQFLIIFSPSGVNTDSGWN